MLSWFGLSRDAPETIGTAMWFNPEQPDLEAVRPELPDLPFDESIEPSANVGATPPSSLKRAVKYGVCRWWPLSENLIHPEDRELARSLIPSNRVFARRDVENESEPAETKYTQFEYGDNRFRTEPTMWLEIFCEGFLVGDFVALKSNGGRLRPRLGEITEMIFNLHTRQIEYFLTCRGIPIDKPFSADQLSHVPRLGSFLNGRQMKQMKPAI